MGHSSMFSYNLSHFRVGKWMEIMYLLLDLGSVLDRIYMEKNEETMKENYLLVLIQHPIPLQQQFSSSSVVKYLQICVSIYLHKLILKYLQEEYKKVNLLFYTYLL